MSVELTLEIDARELTARLMGVVQQIEGPVLDVAGRAMLDYFKDYHTDFSERWKGPRHIEGGSGGGRFGADVVLAWQNPVRSGDNEVTVTNIHPYLAHKITGGPITPKRGKYLTIPITSEAKGRLVADFESSKGVKLFRIGNALAYRGPSGKAVMAYALSRGVNQEPWPGAMPSEHVIQQQFTDALTEAMEARK